MQTTGKGVQGVDDEGVDTLCQSQAKRRDPHRGRGRTFMARWQPEILSAPGPIRFPACGEGLKEDGEERGAR